MKKTILLITTLLLSCSFAATCSAEQKITAVKVDNPPVIDGNDNDPVWSIAKQLTTLDKQKELSIGIKAVYTDKDIYVLVKFQDPDESRTHKN